MDIFEKLDLVDNQMKKDLKEEKRRQEEEKKIYEQESKKRAEEKRIMEENDEIEIEDEDERQEKEKIKAILADNTEGIDEPHWYNVVYEYNAGEDEFSLIMTEREKKLADVTKWLEQYMEEYVFDTDWYHKILSVETLNREMTKEEEIKLNAVKEKVKTIKESEDGNKEVVVDFYHDDFEEKEIPIKTTLKQALLTQVSDKEEGNFSGKIRGLDKIKEQETKDEVLTEKPKTKVTLASIKEAVSKFWDRGER